MYQVTRKNRIKESVQLCHADGTVAETIEVDLNVDEIGNRANKAFEMLGMAQLELQKNSDSAALQEAYGNAVLAVFNVIFGKDGTSKLIAFYEGNYTEMLLDMFPFINNEVMPKIRLATAARKDQLIEAARLARKGNRRDRRRGFRR